MTPTEQIKVALNEAMTLDDTDYCGECAERGEQALALLDDYVLVPKAAVPSKKPVKTFEHNEHLKTVLLDEQTYQDLNRCACLLHKAMIGVSD